MHCACQRMTVLDLAYEGHNIIKTGELEYSRLRGSAQTSTLKPDADNAAVGSHDKKIFCRRHQMSPVFLLYRKLLVFIIGLGCQWILALGSITNRGGKAW